MSKQEIRPRSQWTGLIGRIGGRLLRSYLRRLLDLLFLGDSTLSFLNEVYSIVKGNEVILDVGAGSGYFSLQLAKKVTTGKVICLDLSREMLQHLERRAKKEGLKDRIEILKAEASSSGLRAKSVDLTVSTFVFHELSDPEAALEEMVRVLKPNGWVIVTDFRDTWIFKLIGWSLRHGAHGPFHIDEFETLFAKADLGNLKVTLGKHFLIGIARKQNSV